MSTDYDVVCDTCELRAHAGQRMAGSCSFGHGSADDVGHRRVAEFMFEHAEHGEGVRVEPQQSAEPRRSDAYRRPAWDE